METGLIHKKSPQSGMFLCVGGEFAYILSQIPRLAEYTIRKAPGEVWGIMLSRTTRFYPALPVRVAVTQNISPVFPAGPHDFQKHGESYPPPVSLTLSVFRSFHRPGCAKDRNLANITSVLRTMSGFQSFSCLPSCPANQNAMREHSMIVDYRRLER